MSKLYEILAVEPDLRKKADESLKWVRSVFTASNHLTGQVISYHPLTEDAQEIPDERTELSTNVDALLAELRKVFGSYMDASIRKEVTNTATSADVVLEPELEFLSDFPATALLNLEQRLDDLRKVYEAIPTLDPTERWNPSDVTNCFVSDVRVAYRTKKVPKAFVRYEATKEHPAQVETYTEDVPTHKRETVIHSGMLTQEEKSNRLGRLGTLQQAVKQARQRSNDCEVTLVSVAGRIFDYINTGKVE